MKDWLGRIKSRKFLVWVTASVAMFVGKIDGKAWIIVSCIYIGGNVLKGLIEVFKAKKEV